MLKALVTNVNVRLPHRLPSYQFFDASKLQRTLKEQEGCSKSQEKRIP